MSAKPNITVSDLGKVSFNPDLGPEEGAEAAWAHIRKLVDEHNDLQAKALVGAWNDALDRAAELIGELADRESEKYAALIGKQGSGEKEKHAAISLNAAAISLSTLRKSMG